MTQVQPSLLAQKLAKRLSDRQALRPAEEAALAYARWQGLTDEIGLDETHQKAELDRLLDEISPDQWQVLTPLIERSYDATLKGLLIYSAARAREQIKEFQNTLPVDANTKSAEATKEPHAPVKRRSRDQSR